MPRTRSPRSRPPVREPERLAFTAHLLVAVVAWVGFAWLWVRVFLRTPPVEGVRGAAAVVAVLALCAGTTVAWIRHNRLLHDRLGDRRRDSGERPYDWSHDAVGRPVSGPEWESLRAAPEIEVDVDPASERKLYRGF